MQPKHYIILVLAAILEVSGDAIIRAGLPHWSGGAKALGALVIAAGVVVLGIYGIFVNKAPLDFSSTLGLYVAFFAVVACIIGGIRDHGEARDPCRDRRDRGRRPDHQLRRAHVAIARDHAACQS